LTRADLAEHVAGNLGWLGKVIAPQDRAVQDVVKGWLMQVDWSGWAEQDRTPMQKGAVSADKSTEVDEAVRKAEGVLTFLPFCSLPEILP